MRFERLPLNLPCFGNWQTGSLHPSAAMNLFGTTC